jgi:hypothetical protein
MIRMRSRKKPLIKKDTRKVTRANDKDVDLKVKKH